MENSKISPGSGRSPVSGTADAYRVLQRGTCIPASPLALTSSRTFDERRQRAIYRYYAAAGAGGIAVGVHTTQFGIRKPEVGLFRPVLEIAAEEMNRADALRTDAPRADAPSTEPLVRIAGICGPTQQALQEAELARAMGYHAGLISLAALRDADEDALIAHCRRVGEVIPLVGFYLQPAVGGRVLSYSFWRRLMENEHLVAVKIAPFNRYQTLDVVRAATESGRDNIALYTGNDDNIVADLITPYRFRVGGRVLERRIVGGLLGHWSVWTRAAVQLLRSCHDAVQQKHTPQELLRLNVEVTDANAAFFDAANGFAGCIPGLHEVLRRQGLLEGVWCLDPHETLSPGQEQEIDRVYAAYPHLNDDEFVAQHRDEWLAG